MTDIGIWQLQLLVLTLKCFSTISKTLVPLSFVELHHNNDSKEINFDKAEENYSLAHENAFFVVLLVSIIYNWCKPEPPGKYLGAIAVVVQGSSCFLIVLFALYPTSYILQHVLSMYGEIIFLTLHFLQLFSAFIISQHITYYSVSNSFPSSGLKLVPTIVVALLQILFLCFPQYLATMWALVGFGLVLHVLLFYLYSSIYANDSHVTPKNKAEKEKEKGKKEKKGPGSVTFTTGISFLCISTIGLNGEQLLDSMMTVKIRDEYFAGSKGSGIAKQAITLISAILALLSTFKIWTSKSQQKDKSHLSATMLILIWTFAQFIRVFFFSDTYNTSNFLFIIGLILLDKYTGTLGEIAVEQGLLNFLHINKMPIQQQEDNRNYTSKISIRIPNLWLMTVHGFIEDFTQGLCRKVVRLARKAPPSQFILYAFWQNRTGVVCGLVCVATIFVIATERKRKKKQM